MNIEATSVYVACMIFFATLPRIIYFAIVNKRRYPDELFKGRYMLCGIFSSTSVIAATVLALLLSHDFYYLGIFFTWAICCGILMCLYFTLWVLFWMHGYEARYQFYKVVTPAPMCVLSTAIMFFSGLATLNYYVIGLSVVYGIFAYLWNCKGYKLTKPAIPDDVPIREDED